MADEGLSRAFSEAGVLLIAPDGLNGDWSFPGADPLAGLAKPARDELAFVHAVLADVRARLPVDQTRLWATGFSIGGSMVWYMACDDRQEFAAFVPVGGAFWLPMRRHCGGPVNLMHIHGLTDATVPLEGRQPVPGYVQGDIFAGMARLRQLNGCPTAPSRFERSGVLMCRIWEGCKSSHDLRLCLHPNGHELQPAWILDSWDWVRSAAP
jgi:polyhydroxybutyrate depolymerase